MPSKGLLSRGLLSKDMFSRGALSAGMLAACLMLLASLMAGMPPTAAGYGESTASHAPTPQSPSRAPIPDEAKLRRPVRAPVAAKVAVLRPVAVATRHTAETSPPLRRIGPPDVSGRPPSEPPRHVRHSRAPPASLG